MRNQLTRISALILGIMAVTLSLSGQAHAYTTSRLMDDAVFDNVGSMTETQIRSFIAARPNTCLTRTGPGLGGGNIFPEPKDYFTYGPNTVDAARVIYVSSVYSGINPQVVLATLQKEQSLMSDNDCLDTGGNDRLIKAMGQGCPDGGVCPAPAYAGFQRQVMKGAWQLKFNKERAVGNVEWGDNGSIVYPEPYTQGNRKNCTTCTLVYRDSYKSIDGQLIKLETGATASLYRYTPHLGQAFPGIFEGWFGSTYGDHYSFNSATNPPASLVYGDTATVELKLNNTSAETWYADGSVPAGDSAHRLIMANYANSPFADTTDPAWLGSKNQVRMVEPTVAPGGIATFRFRLKAPSVTITNQQLNMLLVKDGVVAYKNLGLQFLVSSTVDYAYQIQSMDSPVGILPGDMYLVKIKLVNTGGRTWYNDTNVSAQNPHPIRLATPYYVDSPYAFPSVDPSWLGTKNQIKLAEASVAPGAVGTFSAIFTGPYKAVAPYSHNFEMVLDGVKFVAGAPMAVKLNTPTPAPDYAFVSATNPPTTMRPGDVATPFIKIRNTGNMIWRNFDNKILNGNGSRVELGDVRILTNVPVYHNSPFAAANTPEWLGTKNQARMVEAIVPPGAVATFQLPLTAPGITGKYLEYFIFGVDGYAIMRDLGLAYPVTVAP